MLSTSDRRFKFPKRYVRKDARTLCLALDYGHCIKDAANKHDPERRALHKLSEHAEAQFRKWLPVCNWPEQRAEQVRLAFHARVEGNKPKQKETQHG